MQTKQFLYSFSSSKYHFQVIFIDAIDNMRAVWQRTLLSLLGIAIGTASVTSLISIGQNTANESERQFRSMGTNLIVVQNSIDTSNLTHSGKMIDFNDINLLKRKIAGVDAISPVEIYPVKIGNSSRLIDATAIGTDEKIQYATKISLDSGRYISDRDSYDAVAVVGSGIAQELIAKEIKVKLGDMLRIDNYLYKIVGILKESSHNPLLPFDVNHSVFLHYKSSRRLEFYTGSISNLIIGVQDGYDPIISVNEIASYLSQLGRSAQAQGAQQLAEGLQHQNRLFTWMLMGIGSISLLVGGIGVMNVMLASVSERRKEIGLRMAIGANRRSIMLMIISESVILSLLGGIIGTVLGLLIAVFFGAWSGWVFSMPYFVIPIGIGIALVSGLSFGIYPALKASRLSPIEALR